MNLPTRSDLLDVNGRPLTLSLFLELGYSDYALYTLKECDHEYKGKVYPSIKQLYIEKADPTEYTFANTYFLGWKHWLRLCENKQIRVYIDEWREELEVKIRCQGIKDVIASAKGGSFQAAKWISDRGWKTRGAGRPSREEVDREIAFQSKIDTEYGADVVRLFSAELK